MNEIQLKLEQKRLLEEKLRYRTNLPHLYGWKWYKWAREYFESHNHYNLLAAANQISKSSTQIRKVIHWATESSLWLQLWRTNPLQFWYLYPTKDVSTIEFEKKWVPQFLPREGMKNDSKYGWRVEYKNKYVHGLHFNSGVSIYFKTYAQDAQDLQTGTVDAIFCDEELPEELFPELNMRIGATDGYFHAVFTFTLGQDLWRCAMEEIGSKDETLAGAFKKQVSMYECLTYEDGTPSHWTTERIERIKNSLKSQPEIDRRVYGRCVVDGNLKYPSFSRQRNLYRDEAPPPDWWIYYSGSDIGSGGKESHPAAITFVAVRPDFKYGRVFKGWRGDGIVTTSSDIIQQHAMMRGGLKMTGQFYDWQAKDFYTISTRIGESFTPADKSHDVGEQILNVLFKNKMLDIDDIGELKPLVTELVTLKKDTPKRKAKDDFADALRYNVTKIPWDFSGITGEKLDLPDPDNMSPEERVRRGMDEQSLEDQLNAFGPDEELDGWDEMMEI